jgi:7-cyano-7-deazaguanosine (preQ0) biosynthesis protein QueE
MPARGVSELVVSEVFGPTVQGEGPSAGMSAVFIRLGECNLTCQWCDTPYTWDWSRYDKRQELRRVPVPELADQVRRSRVPLLVVTGGEPLIQQQGIIALLRELGEDRRRVEIETNGTIVPGAELVSLVDQFNVSPKLANSKVRLGKRVRAKTLAVLEASGKANFKFVVEEPSELLEIRELADTIGLSRVYVMPQGRSQEEIVSGMRSLVEPVAQYGWNLTTRLQVLIWGDRRGV